MTPLPRWIAHSASFAVGSLVTATAICLQKEISTTETKQLLDDGSNNNNTIKHQSYIATNGECAVKLPIHTYKPNENVTIVFDTRTKNPVFVIERLKKSDGQSTSSSSSSISSSRNNKRFHEEQTLPTYHRSRNSHYRNSGYDRGHLAPAADFSSAFTSSSPDNNDVEEDIDKKINDTFKLTNISPQIPQFNRLVWLRLEEFVRRVATQEEEESSDSDKKIETWIITGPIWLPTSTTTTSTSDSDKGSKKNVNYIYTYEGIGQPPSLVSVPTHFFKVVLVVEKKNQTQASVNALKSDSSKDGTQQHQLVVKRFGAFVLPHSDEDSDKTNNKGKSHIRLVDYLVRLTDLECVTGLDFFPFIGEAAKYVDTATINDTSNSSSIISKEVADALTDDIRYNTTKSKSKMIDSKGDNQQDPNDMPNFSSLSMSNTNSKEVLSKNRRRKIKEILQKNNKSTIPIQHLCRNNNDCYRLLRV